jgi:hypothetical protein
LVPQPPLRLEDLESYAENTASQLLYLQLAAAGEALTSHLQCNNVVLLAP